MQPDVAERFESWAAECTIPRAQARRPGVRLTLRERRSLLLAVDLLLVNAALLVAVTLWNDFPLSTASVLANAKWFLTLSALWFLLAQALDSYNTVRAASGTAIARNTGMAALLTGLLYQAIPWLTPPPGRRLYVFGFLALLVGALMFWRALYARTLAQPHVQRRALVVGDGRTAQRLASELGAAADDERANPFRGTGYQIAGFVDRIPPAGPTVLDPAHAFIRLLRTQCVDEILVAQDAPLSPALHEALLDCRELNIPVTALAEAYERLTHRMPVDYARRDLYLVIGKGDALGVRLYEIAKRAIDLGVASLGVLGMGLMTPFVALGNALTSPGPLFYRQHRVGRGGRPFAIVKFRTMRPAAEKDQAVWAREDDDRVTPVGRWLRRMHLDEVPQFLNVLRGEMSVVGPRPERPEFMGEICRELPIYRARHAVRPGITGWAQVRFRYGNSLEDARIKLEYDLYYVKHANLWLDLLIMLQTVPTMLFQRGL